MSQLLDDEVERLLIVESGSDLRVVEGDGFLVDEVVPAIPDWAHGLKGCEHERKEAVGRGMT